VGEGEGKAKKGGEGRGEKNFGQGRNLRGKGGKAGFKKFLWGAE